MVTKTTNLPQTTRQNSHNNGKPIQVSRHWKLFGRTKISAVRTAREPLFGNDTLGCGAFELEVSQAVCHTRSVRGSVRSFCSADRPAGLAAGNRRREQNRNDSAVREAACPAADDARRRLMAAKMLDEETQGIAGRLINFPVIKLMKFDKNKHQQKRRKC